MDDRENPNIICSNTKNSFEIRGFHSDTDYDLSVTGYEVVQTGE